VAVRNLYKQLIWAGRDYPAGLDKLRSGAKRAFFAKKDEKDPEKISQALRHVLEHSRHTLLGVTPTFRLSQGEFVLQELEALVKLHKYRSLQKQYNPNQDEVLASEFERFKKRAGLSSDDPIVLCHVVIISYLS